MTLRNGIAGIYQCREFAAAGGMISYGGNLADAYRLVGVYAGRILKGEKPADMPVQQVTRVDLIINMKTAQSLGIEVPTGLLVRAGFVEGKNVRIEERWARGDYASLPALAIELVSVGAAAIVVWLTAIRF